jgi:DNA polymerase
MLELRQAVSKTSTAKYQAFEMRSRYDGRLRDILMYWAASTGRWGGKGVQPQNFPRGTIKNTIQAAGILAEGDLELVRMIYGDPMSAFSSCLRNMIVAPEGKVFDVADYAAIETRVLFWVANHEAGLKALREDRDLYCEQASDIYGRHITKEDALERQVGKGVILGCGYQMGWKKFLQTCLSQGITIDEAIAQKAVTSYRTVNYPVVRLWDNTIRAAIAAVLNPKKRFKINHVTWFVENGFLWCELPSGRRLAYYGPEVRYEMTPWGDKRPVLYHYGVNPVTRKWQSDKTYGGRLVENIIQAISRDLMAEAMLKIEATGIWEIVLSVHDELIGERKKGEGSNELFNELMSAVPAWGEGLPVKVEGWSGERYRK